MFDALAGRLQLSEEHLLSCYLGVLDEEIQLAVRMFCPKSVQQALCLAKLQEAAQKAKKVKPNYKPPLLPTPATKPVTTLFPKPTMPKPTGTLTSGNRKTLTPEEFNDKRAKNLCFWCDERYVPGHKCKGKKPQLYHIEMEDEEEENTLDCLAEKEPEADTECAQISVQAMDGITTYQTMRVTGHHGKKDLQILLDSGSTHNFLDLSKALKMDCKVENILFMWVKVANGSQLKCDSII